MRGALRYRLGLDIGSTSIGWCMLRLNHEDPPKPVALIKMGVRIFPDGRNPKDGSSLAATRRSARAMRRRRDRLLKRKNRLMEALVHLGFFPKDAEQRAALAQLDPYALRKKGLDEALTPAEYARALFHINQRRGFKSNRKTDKGASDSSKLKNAIKQVGEKIKAEGARTVGEWLANRHEKRESVRARLRGSGAKADYDFYIDRAMIEAEFDALWAKQSELQPALFTEEKRKELKNILLFQRPLRPVKPGRCTLMPDEERAPLALPSVQRFRIFQEVNNLRLLDKELLEKQLTLEQRDKIVGLLEKKKELTFTEIKTALSLSGIDRFNLEDGAKRDKLKGNATNVQLAKKDCFGPMWFQYTERQQDVIVMQLVKQQNLKRLFHRLEKYCGIDEIHAERIANALLPEGYGSLCRKAVDRILPELQHRVVTFYEAKKAAGFQDTTPPDEIYSLPYYGEALPNRVGFARENPRNDEERFGKIANPTVHIGLNELRKVVNRLIERYGHPSEIVVEVARELKQSKDKRDEIRNEQGKRQKENERFKADIKVETGFEAKALDIQKYRLWMELSADPTSRKCPYTGEHISLAKLYSDEVEIEHILPFSMTLDDSMNNKTVSMRHANRYKGNQTPHKAFGDSLGGYDYAAILERAKLMPKEKAKRFAEDGYQRWLKEDDGFLARALTDTAYLSRIAKEYLSLICPHNKVRAIPGRLTAMLRGKFSLNHLLSGTSKKNRNDHRHHAIDAAVIAITDQGLLQRFAQSSARAREKGLGRLIDNMPDPWISYRDQVANAVEKIIISFKPDHGYQGGLHNDTTYGLRPEGKVVHRVPLDKFSSDTDIEKTEFANDELKAWLLEQTQGLSGKDFKDKLAHITAEFRHRRVKVLEKLTVLAFKSTKAGRRHGLDDEGQLAAYKGYLGNSNYCIEILRLENGKWEGEVISTFKAYEIVKALGDEAGFARLRDPGQSQSGKALVMRLMIDDLVKMEVDGVVKYMRCCSIKSNAQMAFAENTEANVDARNRDPQNDFSYITKYPGSLQKTKARRITISTIGEQYDPGFKG